MIPCCERAGTAGRADKGSNLAVSHIGGGLFNCIAGDVAVEAVVGHQFELREDYVLFRLAYVFIVGTFQSQDYVRFGARREVQFTTVFADAFVPFLTHRVGHHDNGLVAF